jgi:hypothetical protein
MLCATRILFTLCYKNFNFLKFDTDMCIHASILFILCYKQGNPNAREFFYIMHNYLYKYKSILMRHGPKKREIMMGKRKKGITP